MPPYVGEIRMFAGSFAPNGWALCDGATQFISENDTLFNLIGTIYGGDGEETFKLPDLRGRAPVHIGPGSAIGQAGGVESVMLTANETPTHSHALMASANVANLSSPANAVTGAAAKKLYRVPAATVTLAANTVAPIGGSLPHDNMQPYVAINYVISLFGIFPSGQG